MTESFDVLVIGSGPAGYVAAIRAAQLGLSTACVEKSSLGGTCLNIGCIPSKTLLHASEQLFKIREESSVFGIQAKGVSYDFSAMQKKKEEVVTGFQKGIGFLFQKNKITKLSGEARFISPNSVEVSHAGESRQVSAKHIILATGSEPTALPFLPFGQKRVLSSTEALSLQEVPKKLLVIGAGAIGIELGSVYKRLGSEVVFVEFLDRICPFLDESASKELQSALEKQGMEFHLSYKVSHAEVLQDKVKITAQGKEKESIFEADYVLVSIGRKPYTQGLGLEKIGIKLNLQGKIEVDGKFRTNLPHIYAIGDVIDGPMLAHKGSEEGTVVAEIIAGMDSSLDYMTIPNIVYSYPEVAAVGLTEQEAKKLGIDYVTGSFPFSANSRAKCIAEEKGFVKVIGHKETDRLLGMHIVSAHASELIAIGAVALKEKMTLSALAHTPFAHPTLSEACKEACLAAHKRAVHR